jgi:hypothetical protein
MGTLQACDDAWCLDDVPLVLGVNPDLSVVQGDYNHDRTAKSVAQELADLIDTRVRVGADANGLVLTINRLDYVPAELPTDQKTGTSGHRDPTKLHSTRHHRARS